MIITEVRIVVHNSKLFFIIPFYKNLFALGAAKARHATRGGEAMIISIYGLNFSIKMKFLKI